LVSDEVQESADNSIPKKKSYRQELNPWSGINPGIEKDTSFFFLFIRPWPLVVYPAVIYSFLVFSFAVASLLIVLNTSPTIFQSPPYNFSPGIQSLIFIPGMIGSAIGAFTGGALTDRLIKWRTKANNGIFEAENRLLVLVFPLLIVPAGLLLYHPQVSGC
jgi:MFS family permease